MSNGSAGTPGDRELWDVRKTLEGAPGLTAWEVFRIGNGTGVCIVPIFKELAQEIATFHNVADLQKHQSQGTPGDAVKELQIKILADIFGREFPNCDATRAACEALIAESLRPLLEKHRKLLDTLETCHVCKAALLLGEDPPHCEDCSGDCDDHDEPECATIQTLHRANRAELTRWETRS